MSTIVPPQITNENEVTPVTSTNQSAPWWAWPLAAVVCVGMLCGTAGGLFVYAMGYPSGGAAVDVQRPSLAVDLASKIADENARNQVSAYFRDLSVAIRDPSCPVTTSGEFRQSYRASVKHFVSLSKLPDLEPIDKPISDSIAAAIGLSDQSLDGEPPLRHSLANVLEDISNNIGK